jgi:hypothetical protein
MQGSAGDNYLNIVLDTKTDPYSNHAHPSYGRIRILEIVPVPGPAEPPNTVANRADFMAGVVNTPTTLGFDELPTGTLIGDEYASSGVTIVHLDGQPIKVSSFPVIPGWVVPSAPNVISSSYSSSADPGYAAAPCACGVYFNNAHADHFRFEFSTPVRSAGIQLGENDLAGITVRWLDEWGAVIATRVYSAGSPSMELVGLVGSTTPIAAMEVWNGAGDGDGMFFDDLIFEPFTP